MNGLAAAPHDVLLVVLRTIVVYVFVLIGLRLMGKREAGQMTPFDLALLLLLANAVQNAMVGPDTSLVGGLVAAGVLLLLNATVGKLSARNRWLAGLLRGHPRILVNRGIVQATSLKEEGIDQEELMQALREHGIAGVDDVRLAVLEVDGSISVVRNEDVAAAIHKPHHRIRFRQVS